MRYYLDTNILAFLYSERQDEISNTVMESMQDYSNHFLTSAVCVHELIHLCQIGKLQTGKKKQPLPSTEILEWIGDMDISIQKVDNRHLQKLSELPIQEDHRDPNDRLIIAQAIVDRIPLVSSDRKFARYSKFGLDFIFNER